MNDVRVGRIVRAVRHQQRLRQSDVARVAGVVPGLAEIAATPDMGDGVDDTAVEQTQPVR
jgi:transcriptional regulator with XRE-family HTH domain